MRRILSSLVCILSVTYSWAQVDEIRNLFYDRLEGKSKKEYFAGQFLKGKRNGTGFLKNKDNSVYLGDFSQNKISGIGVLISAENQEIDNCKDAVVYIGKFENGSKKGKGKCYDIKGNLIYEGRFDADKPVEEYPSASAESRRFLKGELDNGDVYVGEVDNMGMNGIVMLLLKDGDLFYCNFRNNALKGYYFCLGSDNEWATYYLDNGESKIISSSKEYKALAADRKSINSNLFSSLFGNMGSSVSSVGSVNSYGSSGTLNAAQGDMGLNNNNDFSDKEKGNSYEYYKSQYDRWERNAKSCYESLTNTGYKVKKNGNDVGGSAAGSWGTVAGTGMKQNLRNAQREMQKIRQQARKDGHNIPQSRYETINVSL